MTAANHLGGGSSELRELQDGIVVRVYRETLVPQRVPRSRGVDRSTSPAGIGAYAVVPSLMLPPGWVKLLPWLEYVAGRCRNFEYVLIVHETGPRKK